MRAHGDRDHIPIVHDVTGGLLEVLAAATGAALAPKPAAARESAADARRARYQPDSAGVRRFYETNGYETLRR